jgi:uridine phosphorylase
MSIPTLYLRAVPETTGDLILLCGDPARVDFFTQIFPQFQFVSQNREFSIATGTYQGHRVSIVSAGIGGPSTAIALEELKQLGVRAVVRFGTMMGLAASMGSVVIPSGAVCEEGTSRCYLSPSYPAVPDWDLQHTLIASARRQALDVCVGLSVTFDGFYTHLSPDLVGRAQTQDWDAFISNNVLAADMETSLVFNAGRALGIPSASICLVTVHAGQRTLFLDAETRTAKERLLLSAALDGLIDFGKSITMSNQP